MASLTLAVGSLSVRYTIADAQAVIGLTRYIRTYGGPQAGTNQAKLLWVLRQVGRYMMEVSAGGVQELRQTLHDLLRYKKVILLYGNSFLAQERRRRVII